MASTERTKTPLREAPMISVWLATDRVGDLAMTTALMRERRWRVEVVTLSTVASASNLSPDVVVIDRGAHPPFYAFGFAQKLRGWYKGPVVVLTSLRLPSVTDQARIAACSCVTTPCRSDHVVACVYSALAMSNLKWPRRRDESGLHRVARDT